MGNVKQTAPVYENIFIMLFARGMLFAGSLTTFNIFSLAKRFLLLRETLYEVSLVSVKVVTEYLGYRAYCSFHDFSLLQCQLRFHFQQLR